MARHHHLSPLGRFGSVFGDDRQHSGAQPHLGLIDGDERRRFGAGEHREQEEEAQPPIGQVLPRMRSLARAPLDGQLDLLGGGRLEDQFLELVAEPGPHPPR